MSIIGILSSNLFSAGAAQNPRSPQTTPTAFEQIKTELQQLGQDLQSGDLKQAQSDFTTLSKNLSSASPLSAASANPASGGSTIQQAFAQLGKDLQAGNLQAAQTDFTNLEQDVQQNASQLVAGHHGHHHRTESAQSSADSSQQTNPVNQAFRTLEQDLQAENLSGAQSAFSALQNDLQQIGGFLPAGSTGTFSTAVPSSTGLSVNA